MIAVRGICVAQMLQAISDFSIRSIGGLSCLGVCFP